MSGGHQEGRLQAALRGGETHPPQAKRHKDDVRALDGFNYPPYFDSRCCGSGGFDYPAFHSQDSLYDLRDG